MIGVLVVAATTKQRAFSGRTFCAELQALAAEAAPVIERLRARTALAESLERERLAARIADRSDLDAVLEHAVAVVGRRAALRERCFVRLGRARRRDEVKRSGTREGLEPIGDLSLARLAGLQPRDARALDGRALRRRQAPSSPTPRTVGARALLELGSRSVARDADHRLRPADRRVRGPPDVPGRVACRATSRSSRPSRGSSGSRLTRRGCSRRTSVASTSRRRSCTRRRR